MDFPIEHHYTVPFSAQQKLSATTAKLIALNPELILGGSHLYEYDANKQAIVPSLAFQKLLEFLVSIHELDPQVRNATTLSELNAILQQPQGAGGFLRKAGTERWHLTDNEIKKQN